MFNPVGQWVSVKKHGLPVLEGAAGKKYYKIDCEFISKFSGRSYYGYIEYKRDNGGNYKPLHWVQSDDTQGCLELEVDAVVAWLIRPAKPALTCIDDDSGVYYILAEDTVESA